MSENLKRLNLKDLENVCGGQVYYAERNGVLRYFVPNSFDGSIDICDSAWEAKTRAKDLKICTSFVKCGSVFNALSVAKTQAQHLKSIRDVSACVE